MDKKNIILNKLKKFQKNLKKIIDVKIVIFFGSMASGKPNKDSDIDLLIVSKSFENKKFRYRALGFYDFWDLDYPVDFLCYTPKEFNKLKKQITIVKEAVEAGIEIK